MSLWLLWEQAASCSAWRFCEVKLPFEGVQHLFYEHLGTCTNRAREVKTSGSLCCATCKYLTGSIVYQFG